MKTLNELRHQRGSIVDKMKAINDKAESEERDLTAEESTEWDQFDTEQTEIQNRIKRIEKQEELENALDIAIEDSVKVKPTGSHKTNPLGTDDYSNAFNNYIRKGEVVRNALEVGTNSEGGYIVPEEYDTKLVQALLDYNEIRSYANVITTASSRKIPVEDSVGAATWTDEEAAYTEGDPAFSQKQLDAYKLGKIIKVSEELLNDSFFDLAAYVANNFGRAFGTAEESAFVNGDGSSKPTGIVGGSTLGVPFAGATAITADELIDLFHSLGRPYRGNAVFMVNDSTAKLIRKLKDGDQQYLWQAGLQAGQPDMLLGRPVLVSSAMPAATTGLKSMVFGDLSGYTIADRSGTVMQRLNELYAATGQVGFRMNRRTDGKVIDSNAIVHGIQA